MTRSRPDLALLNERQVDSIRADLREMKEKQPWAEITGSDVDRLDSLALILDPEYRQGRGHDCRWTWTNGEIIITGTCDVYGNGMPAMWCRPEEWWVTADGEEYEP